jgi:hypothetical protein
VDSRHPPATCVVLSSTYRCAAERSFDRRLGVYLRALAADVAAPGRSAARATPTLGDPIFELPLSGASIYSAPGTLASSGASAFKMYQ